jgi:hypothetical protein
MPIRWDTLLSDETGVVDYVRVRALAAVLLALLGGLIVVVAGLVEMFIGEVPHNALMIAVGALVLPLTGGKIMDAVSNRGKPEP